MLLIPSRMNDGTYVPGLRHKMKNGLGRPVREFSESPKTEACGICGPKVLR